MSWLNSGSLVFLRVIMATPHAIAGVGTQTVIMIYFT